MALPTPKLDHRTFQDLVDEAKRRIPTYCPGWTDHNVSDPGITLIELFAYMTEQYLYRLNQVPDKNYIAFLNLLGIQLEPPLAARGAVTFTLVQPLRDATIIIIPKGTEVATERTATAEAVVLTTDCAARVERARLQSVLTTTHVDIEKARWEDHSQELMTWSPAFNGWPTNPIPFFETKDSLSAFSVDGKFEAYITGMMLATEFREEFKKQKIDLSDDTAFTVTEERADLRWKIVVGKQTFIVRKEKNTLEITLEPDSISGNLDNQVLAPALRQAFKDHHIQLSDDTSIIITPREEPGGPWRIDDAGQRTCIVSKEDQNLKISWEPKPAFLLGFENDLSAHVLGVTIQCEESKRGPIPWLWEVYRSIRAEDGSASAHWMKLELPSHEPQGVAQDTQVILYLPDHCQELQLQDKTAKTWLRCSPAATQQPGEAIPPLKILSAKVETRGITVPVTHAQMIGTEILGTSNGQPGQRFQLMHQPVLQIEDEKVEVEIEGGKWEAWTQMPDFGRSAAVGDRGELGKHFVFEPVAGVVEFGPQVTRPNDQLVQFGAIPPRGRRLRISSYRIDGGFRGNIDAGAVTVLKSTIEYVKSVCNRAPITGGKDAQTLEEAKLWAPARLRTQNRAVTAEDFEYWAQQVPGVGRAHCVRQKVMISKSQSEEDRQSEEDIQLKPGTVQLLIIPDLHRLDDSYLDGYIHARKGRGHKIDEFAQEFEVVPDIRTAIKQALEPRRLLATELHIAKPTYIWVTVEIGVKVGPRINAQRVEKNVQYALHRWLHPLYGGDEHKGWPYGRDVTIDRIYALVYGIEGIEYAYNAKLFVWKPYKDIWKDEAPHQVDGKDSYDIVSIPSFAIISSSEHRVIMEQ